MAKKILVTGGAGFIGSHIAEALVHDGHTVHVMDDLSGGRTENLADGVVFHECDICTPEAAEIVRREGFDVLIHHAAQMDVRRSVADPQFDARINVLGMLNLLEAGRASGLKKVLFASTGGAIYGDPDYVPQDEAHPVRPISPYGITKLATEKYLYYYQQQYGIAFVALRYANVYGPRQNPHGEAGVVAIFTERLLDGRQPVIFGDGLQTRDYVYVGDVVAANRAALAYGDSGIFNVGTGVETTVNELFHGIRTHTGSDAPEQHAPGKPGEQRRSVLDNSHSADVLGWSPAYNLEDGLGETVAWFRQKRAQAVSPQADG